MQYMILYLLPIQTLFLMYLLLYAVVTCGRHCIPDQTCPYLIDDLPRSYYERQCILLLLIQFNNYQNHQVNVSNKNILFGFVGSNGIIDVLNYCILYAKYYIYTQRLFNQNKLDVYVYLTFLKNTLTKEGQISINNNKLDKLEKISIVYDQL